MHNLFLAGGAGLGDQNGQVFNCRLVIRKAEPSTLWPPA